MKIGVLTYHSVPNFGAQLQALSTVGYLKSKGHEAIVINWYAKDLEEMYFNRIPIEQKLCHEDFCKTFFPLSKKCQTIQELIKVIDNLNLDAIISGSDALFKYIPFRKRARFCWTKLRYIPLYSPLSCELLDNNPFFGSFISSLKNNIPAATYAVSSQNCPFQLMSFSEKKRMKQALSNYQYISVRDKWTSEMVMQITGIKKIQIFPDPVFSFNKNCYISIPTKQEVCNKYGLSENYVLFSFSDWYCEPSYIEDLSKAAIRKNLQPVALPMPEKLFAGSINNIIQLPLSPIWWYALILHSRGYVGERMHPIVVCLHNAIPFFVFDEYGIKKHPKFFSKKEEFLPNSSKTNQIIIEAQLESNLYSYNKEKTFPQPKTVIDKLLSFDRKKCLSFANKKQKEYEIGMKETIEHLK